MSRHGIPIGRLFGISVDLDYSWFLIVGLMTWMLAADYYPAEFKGWSAGEYWAMGALTAVSLFASVLIHEFAHALTARRFGLPTTRITLFLFGGVSRIAGEPPSAAAEFWIAVVGPLASLALAAFCWSAKLLLAGATPLFAWMEYLAWMNLLLAAFNLLPGFPLDGGRVYRALIWRITGSYHRATLSAALTGRFFGFLLIFFGVWLALAGNLLGGIWIAFIGWFLESAAGSQLHQETLRNLLGGHKVSDAMRREFPQVPANVTLQELVDRSILPANARYAIVTDPAGPAGMVTLAAIREVPRREWSTATAAQIMIPFQKLATTQPNAILWSALEKMGRDGVNQLPVVEGNRVEGMLLREDIVQYLGLLQALEE